MNPTINFVLHEALPRSQVIGRNCGSDDLPLGTVFTALCRRDYPETDPSDPLITPDPVFVCALSLRVDAIEMFHRSFDFVGRNYGALLSLSGSGFATMAGLLSSAPKRVQYSLS